MMEKGISRVILGIMLAVAAAGCGSTPQLRWKRDFDYCINAIMALPRPGGAVVEYGQFYARCDDLAAVVSDTGYGADLLKDILITHTNGTVRAGAAEVLGRMSDPGAARACNTALEDSDPLARELALKALKRITNEDHGTDRDAWLRSLEKEEDIDGR